MKTLSFLSLVAATALTPASVLAQPAGVSWQAPSAAAAAPRVHHRGPPPPRVVTAPPGMRHFGGPRMHGGGDRVVVRGHPGSSVQHRVVRRFPPHRRIDRGVVLPHHWWGPRFMVWNWNMYGLPQPIPGGRWIRYYDDALLVDGHGRVHDGRWGMKWDDYPNEWGQDDEGVPYYVGNGDYHPGERDRDWVEGEDGPGPDDCRCLPPLPPAYYHPGYMWVSPGMVTVTETITTPTVVYKTVHEQAQPVRRAKPKVRVKPRPAPPSPGERG